MNTSKKLNIPLSLVSNLIKEQFPAGASLPIKPVEKSGWDNRSFRLGEEMLIRLPSAEEYAEAVFKEQKWLPFLAQHLSYVIPKPIALGKPSENYPFHWSIYQWIPGKNADTLLFDEQARFAYDIACFLKELEAIDPTGGPINNAGRGGPPAFYDTEVQAALGQLKDSIDTNAAQKVWQKAITCAAWNKKPVWIHGDFSVGNILVHNGRLAAIIDFGSMGIGDPACDLVIAWTFLTKDARKIFKSELPFDSDTWARARGWALWKALITLVELEDKNDTEALKIKHIIDEIITDYELDELEK